MTYSWIKPPFYDTVSVLEIYVQVTIFLIIFPPRIVKVPFPIGILKSKKKNCDWHRQKKKTPHGSCRGPPQTSWPDFRHQVMTVMTFGHQQNLYYHLVMTMVTKSWPRHDLKSRTQISWLEPTGGVYSTEVWQKLMLSNSSKKAE